MESISRGLHPASSLALSSDFKSINQLNFNFIWRNRTHYIKTAITVQDLSEGGLKAIDFECMNRTLKLNWLKHCVKSPGSICHIFPQTILDKMGGIEFILRCDHNVTK